MSKEFWAGEFGDSYTKRNRVDWRLRTLFWKHIIREIGVRSVYEIGCNCGWNLSAIKLEAPYVYVSGEDVNESALDQAYAAGLDVYPVEAGHHATAELVFTAGVLIHIPPSELHGMMQRIIDMSCDYVLAVEYAADKEEEVEYRGHTGKLWRRPFGKLYQEMGLELVEEGKVGANQGFDDCTYFLLRKPA